MIDEKMMFKIQIIIHIYNGKVCECCGQISKQVNIVVTRMRGPSGPEILVKYKIKEDDRKDQIST